MKQIRECAHSVFISYANDDDAGWYGWVTDFKSELEQVLGARARVRPVPPPFFGKEMPAVSGRLSDTLKTAVASSFAMVIVVHDAYAQSEWCLNELEYFRDLFGDDGFQDRLYIVAMSESAMNAVEQKPDWQRLCPNGDQVWLRFYQTDKRNEPVRIRRDTSDDKGVLSGEFLTCFNPLVSDLAEKIARSANALPQRAAGTGAPASSPSSSTTTAALASTPASALGAALLMQAAVRTPAAPSVLFGATTADLDAPTLALRQTLAAAGTPCDTLTRAALMDDFAAFDAATLLVLPFSAAQPLQAWQPGGHLAIQRDAWLKRGKPADSLLWLDLRDSAAASASASACSPAPPAARAEQAEFINALAPQALGPAALQARLALEKPSRCADSTEAGNGERADDGVRIYIESNQNERLLWQPLGEQIKKKWDKLVAGQQIAPPLFVRPRGLPIDDIERHPPLDDADGVVLFWGKKEPRSLLSQINKVENRLSGRDLAPCIVAYLMPPQPDPKTPIVSWAWDVLRFEAAVENDIDVVPEDHADLDRFLQKILTRSNKKRLVSAAARAVAPLAAQPLQ